jgi:nitroimidazol reductase NimA-like FMN-containing flavoprotein (pyridoxamine 5'-phosphate oxidase superfamily)
MRRSEYKSDDPAEYRFITETAEVGHLGFITPDGYPRVVPLNFVADSRVIYFHGATGGEKYEVLKANPKVTFNIDIPYSILPSYWTSKENAGTKTCLFKSVLIRGRCKVVDEDVECIKALNLLMERYQPEGRYKPISADEPIYANLLKTTAVFRIDAEQTDIKIKFPKNKPDEHKKMLIDKVKARVKNMLGMTD